MIKLPVSKNVLVCPLDWGLGHASRMIPVISDLLKNNNNVILAADELPLKLLQNEFAELKSIRFPSYKIRYSKKMSQALFVLLQLPKVITGIIKEHRELKQIIDEYKIEAVISDNRFGCWSKKTKSVYVTHQIMVKMPKGLKLFEYPGYLVHKWFISRYNECWIPDFEGENNLSGDLSHKYELPRNVSFIGPLSRFAGIEYKKEEKKYDVICILSGPEPQRSMFEEILIQQIENNACKALIVRGQPGIVKPINKENIQFENHLPAEKLAEAIQQSNIVICRSGYSSIMDLVALNKKAILVPTPGQTEQEYLADYITKNKLFIKAEQNELDFGNFIA